MNSLSLSLSLSTFFYTHTFSFSLSLFLFLYSFFSLITHILIYLKSLRSYVLRSFFSILQIILLIIQYIFEKNTLNSSNITLINISWKIFFFGLKRILCILTFSCKLYVHIYIYIYI